MEAILTGLSAQSAIILFSCLAGLVLGGQVLICLWMLVSLHLSTRERARLTKEVYGLLKKIEVLTSSKREKILKHYDGILQNLSTRLPPTIAAEVSQQIIETETKILRRIAELEPNLKNNLESRKKLDEIIHSMEGLERSIVVLASDTVRNVMIESRKSLMLESEEQEMELAA